MFAEEIVFAKSIVEYVLVHQLTSVQEEEAPEEWEAEQLNFRLELFTDNYPSETSWSLTNSAGTVIESVE